MAELKKGPHRWPKGWPSQGKHEKRREAQQMFGGEPSGLPNDVRPAAWRERAEAGLKGTFRPGGDSVYSSSSINM